MRKIFILPLIVTLLLLMITAINSFGQDKKKRPEIAKRVAERHKMHSRDSLMRSFTRSDTSISSLLQRLGHYNTTFNQIDNNLAEGLDTADISGAMPQVLRRINKIDSLINTHKSSSLRYLAVLRDNLDHMQDQLEGWQSDMEDINSKLVQNQTDLIKFPKDTSLKINIADSVVRASFNAHKKAVWLLFRTTDSSNRAKLLKVNLLQDKISTAYTRILDETDQIDRKIQKFAVRAFAGESDFIWNTPLQYNDFKVGLKGTIRLNTFLWNYFVKNETVTHIIGLFFVLVVISWIIFVRVRTSRRHENPSEILSQANYIYKSPVISALLVAFAIVPYFYDHPPVVFLETIFLIPMILTLVLVKKYFPSSSFKFLICLLILDIFYGLSNLFIQTTNVDRYVVLILSIVSIVAGFLFLKKEPRHSDQQLPKARLSVKIFVAVQALSLLLNISGRYTLAKIAGVTAVYNLWFLVILFFVVQIIIQVLFLQFQVKKDGRSIMNWIDYSLVQQKFKNILSTFAIIIWGFFLFQNLNLEDWASDSISDLLNEPRSVGGASFTVGGFVIFIAVIWISSILSRIISYFYDVSSQRVNDLSIAKKKNRTSALLIRLAVFSIGFLLAIAASGFPLDKLTIIISAFGVGIGFGLQNIVNNLVSGVILAFEKPIQIGDVIEVGSRTGTMKEIGVRSSKILTGDGSEVVIPNGDLISQTVVNWTLSNNNRRIELLIHIAYGADIEQVKTLLKDLLSNRDDVMTSKSSVYVNNVSEAAVEFKLFFWADDIANTAELKSRVLADIYTAFLREKIELPAPQKDFFLHFPDGEPALNLVQKTADEKDGGNEKKDIK